MTTLQLFNDTPFSDSQRAWLNGFFSGIQTHKRQSDQSNNLTSSRTIHILYGSQTGNAESVAHDTATVAKAHGLKTIVSGMDAIDSHVFTTMDTVLIITSTYGEGEMPDNAQMLWEEINADTMPPLPNLQFAVLALGDSGYDLFCQAGIDWDNRLAALGAKRIAERIDCDVAFETPAEAWIHSVIPQLSSSDSVVVSSTTPNATTPQYNRKNPFPAKLLVNRLLTTKNSSKETRHYEISIAGSGLSYQAGDALCVIPTNCPELVNDIIQAIGCNGDEQEPVEDEMLSLFEALRTRFEIKLPSKELIQEIATRSGNQELNGLLTTGDKDALADYLWGRDILDLLRQNPNCEFTAAEFLALLKPLQHRAYSISSSGHLYPDTVHLTVASVRYQAHDRQHKGVCSTFLADLVNEQTEVRCFFTPNKVFRVPEDDTLPMIMVGPGTGIAPFRAFLQERQYRKATGKNWLFFGDRNAATDFIYREELLTLQQNGFLKLDLAFSRDQAEKIYVQDKMREQGAELFAWLEQGAYFFVCGDAYQMAKDVDQALLNIVAQHGSLSEAQAIDYVNQLKKDKRYVRDVY